MRTQKADVEIAFIWEWQFNRHSIIIYYRYSNEKNIDIIIFKIVSIIKYTCNQWIFALWSNTSTFKLPTNWDS